MKCHVDIFVHTFQYDNYDTTYNTFSISVVQGKSKDLIDHHQVKSWKYWSVSQYPS